MKNINLLGMMKMKMMMTRCVDSKMRYYSIELICNLFDEWLLIRSYGSMKRKAPTRVIQMLFATKEEAQRSLSLLIDTKAKRGYVQDNKNRMRKI